MTDKARHIVITGVSRGLGRALVSSFVDRGHVVYGCARSELAIDELQRAYGTPHAFACVDVSDDDQVHEWAESVLRVATPDLIVNNAGVINANAALWEISAEEVSRVLDVNVKGCVNVIRHFLPAMIRQGRGVVVNISSGWGRSVSAEVAPYCASKWAVEGLTRALAEEVPPGIAAVPLNPGVIHTEMLVSCFGEDASSYKTPAQWAKRAVPLLLGLDASCNGQVLTV